MRKLFRLPLLLSIVLLTFVSTSSEAVNNAYTIIMYKYYKNSDDKPILDPPPGAHRSPQYRVAARISLSEGMVIPGVDKSEILSYQVFDENGYCTGIFHDNGDFTSFIFKQKGIIEIRIELEEYWLCGYLNL